MQTLELISLLFLVTDQGWFVLPSSSLSSFWNQLIILLIAQIVGGQMKTRPNADIVKMLLLRICKESPDKLEH